MPIEYLIVLSYATAIAFLMSLTGGLGLIAMLRRMRLGTQALTEQSPTPITFDRRHTIVHDVFERLPLWRNNQNYMVQEDKPMTHNLRPKSSDDITFVTLPPRYQYTLLYGDKLAIQQSEADTQPSTPAT